MENYQQILVAIDLSEEAQYVLKRAVVLAENHRANLTLIHVIEPITFAYGGNIPMGFSDIQALLKEQATERLASLGAELDIPPSQQHIIVGQPAAEIHQLAESIAADLIIVGSHGRHGLALLLGSTANSVLHGASCDVMAVRVGKNKH